MARDQVPGEQPVNQMLHRDHIHDRTVNAFISRLDPTNGIATLALNGSTSAGRQATLPVLWASFPAVGQGTWGRFMPFENSVVKVAFDYDSSPHIIGYDIIGPKTSFQSGTNTPLVGDIDYGWTQLVIAQQNGTQAYWTTLESGEFDFMSIGGAYIRGYASGRLLLQAGQTSQSLNKLETRNYETTLTKSIQSQGSQFRFGEIRRPYILGQPETQVPPMPAPSGKEFYVELYDPPTSPVTPGPAIGKFGFATQITQPGFGVVSSTLPLLGPFGSPDRFIMEVDLPEVGTPMFQHEIDITGNVSWIQIAGLNVQWLFNTATTVDMIAPLAAYNTTADTITRTGTTSIADSTTSMTVTAAADYTLTTPLANIAGAVTNLGPLPAGGAINGPLLLIGMTAANAALVAALTAAEVPPPTMPAYATTLTGIITTWAAAVTTAITAATSVTVNVSL